MRTIDRKDILDRQRGRITDEGLGVMIDQLSQCLLSSSYQEDSR